MRKKFLKNFLKILMNLMKIYKKTWNVLHESSKGNIAFLHSDVNFMDGKHLPFSFFHPNHTKILIIYSQTLWLNKIYIFQNDYICHKYEMKSWFLQRGNPEGFIEMEMTKVHFPTRPNKKSKKVTVMYHLLKNLITSLTKRFINFI